MDGERLLDYLLEKSADKRLVLFTAPPAAWLAQHPGGKFTRPFPKALAAVLNRYPTPEQEKQW